LPEFEPREALLKPKRASPCCSAIPPSSAPSSSASSATPAPSNPPRPPLFAVNRPLPLLSCPPRSRLSRAF
jgi:hypothetical protein